MPFVLSGEYWLLHEIAEAENVHRYTPGKWWREGKITGVAMGHSIVLIDGESYRRFSAQRKRQGGAE